MQRLVWPPFPVLLACHHGPQFLKFGFQHFIHDHQRPQCTAKVAITFSDNFFDVRIKVLAHKISLTGILHFKRVPFDQRWCHGIGADPWHSRSVFLCPKGNGPSGDKLGPLIRTPKLGQGHVHP